MHRGGATTCHQRTGGGKFSRQVKFVLVNLLWEISRSPLVEYITTRQSTVLVCLEPSILRGKFRGQIEMQNFPREIKVPQKSTPPPCNTLYHHCPSTANWRQVARFVPKLGASCAPCCVAPSSWGFRCAQAVDVTVCPKPLCYKPQPHVFVFTAQHAISIHTAVSSPWQRPTKKIHEMQSVRTTKGG